MAWRQRSIRYALASLSAVAITAVSLAAGGAPGQGRGAWRLRPSTASRCRLVSPSFLTRVRE